MSIPVSLPTNPMPLGKICPGGAFAAAAVQAIANLKAAGYLGGATGSVADARVREMVIQADAGNGGTIYITNDGLPPAADYSNVLRELAKGETYSVSGGGTINAVDSRKYYVAAENAVDFAIGEIQEG